MVRTLVVDGLVSVFTYLPYKIYLLLMYAVPSIPYSLPLLSMYCMDLIFITVSLTNCFSTPIVYCSLNKDFKVSASACIITTNFEKIRNYESTPLRPILNLLLSFIEKNMVMTATASC